MSEKPSLWAPEARPGPDVSRVSQRWVTGLVFVPDSVGYVAATTWCGGAARALGAERVALAGQLAVAAAALALPAAPEVRPGGPRGAATGCGGG